MADIQRELTIDTVDCTTVFIQEHQRQVYRQEQRLKNLKHTCDYSVSFRRRLMARWTVEIEQDLKAVHGIP